MPTTTMPIELSLSGLRCGPDIFLRPFRLEVLVGEREGQGRILDRDQVALELAADPDEQEPDEPEPYRDIERREADVVLPGVAHQRAREDLPTLARDGQPVVLRHHVPVAVSYTHLR